LALFAVDCDRAAMLLGDDVVADRQAEPRALARRLGGEERLEQFVSDRRRNSHAIVAHPDLDRVALLMRCDMEYGTERAIALRMGALVCGVEPVSEQVEEHARDVLRHQLDRCERRVEIALQREC
jgi:hypothetical protein